MNRRSWLTGLFLIILSSIAIVVRIYYVDHLMVEVNISEDIYNAARVSADTKGLRFAFEDGFRLQSLYISNLYAAFLVFGNFTVAGVYLNILYQMFTIALVYIVIKNVTNRYLAFVGGLVLAILPIYIHTLSEVTIQNMEIFIVTLIGAVVISSICLLYRKHIGKKDVLKNSDEAVHADTNTLMDTSMKEIMYDDLEDNKVQYIENPLPVPKRREHKEMDYAFEPTGSDDDYDMKDVTGKDFYDIE